MLQKPRHFLATWSNVLFRRDNNDDYDDKESNHKDYYE